MTEGGFLAKAIDWLKNKVAPFGVIYIALIGIFAVAELQRREKLLAVVVERETAVSAALAALNTTNDPSAESKRASLDKERATLAGLHARLVTLIIVGPPQQATGPSGTLKGIACDLTAMDDPTIVCAASSTARKSSLREIAATLALKRAAEERSSGDVFAVLVIVAAVGGALIRLYLPNHEAKAPFRSVLRGIGGGIVCYLCISGGGLPLARVDSAVVSSPASGALLGLLAGMFSTKVFELLSDQVESWFEKLSPALKRGGDDAPTDGERSAAKSDEHA